jgi:hypothetical protein
LISAARPRDGREDLLAVRRARSRFQPIVEWSSPHRLCRRASGVPPDGLVGDAFATVLCFVEIGATGAAAVGGVDS